DRNVTGVQTCALPISGKRRRPFRQIDEADVPSHGVRTFLPAKGLESVDAMRRARVAHERWRPEEQSVHDSEHRRIRADAQAERHYDGGRECGLRAQPANGIADVLRQALHAHAILTRASAGWFERSRTW